MAPPNQFVIKRQQILLYFFLKKLIQEAGLLLLEDAYMGDGELKFKGDKTFYSDSLAGFTGFASNLAVNLAATSIAN